MRTMRQDETAISYEGISNLLANKYSQNSRDCEIFLPRDRANSLIQRGRVVSTLCGCLPQMTQLEIETLADYVMLHAKQVFLTLVFSGTLEHIQRLQRNGFKDQDLPVYVGMFRGHPQLRSISQTLDTPLDCFRDWGLSEIDRFSQVQWIFLAPVFRQDQFDYKFHNDHRLPFIPSDNPDTDVGYFGMVRRLQIHSAHYEGPRSVCRFRCANLKKNFINMIQWHESTNDNTHNHIDVAVKVLIGENRQIDVDKFYEREGSILKVMKALNHKHLIKALAKYEKGNVRCFLFPWANGGNLQYMMETDRRELDIELVNWVLLQIIGLSSGVEALHNEKIRHGDIKPSNILNFDIDPGTSNQSILVIADVGIAKLQPGDTRDRNISTTNRHGSYIYEPPEVCSKGLLILSRKYDIWSLGCVFLELTIWMIYGKNGLILFHKDLGKDPSSHRFWIDSLVWGQQKHPVVIRWIKRLKKDMKGISAVRDLILFLDERLLVLVERRADSHVLVNQLREIQSKAASNSEYLFNDAIRALANSRKGSSPTEPDKLVNKRAVNRPLSQRSWKLENKWRNVTDNDQAKLLLFELDWASLKPVGHTYQTCRLFKIFDSTSTLLDLQLSIDELERDSSDCSLCRVILLSLAKFKITAGKHVNLFRDDVNHTLRGVSEGPPILSIYSDPASGYTPSYAQIGLPSLPEPGSSQQFKLLNEWIKLCDDQHSCIQGNENAAKTRILPTRLINVGSEGLRLVETSNSTQGNYVALSHCWGKLKPEEKFCTYSHNIEILKGEILYESLPQNFKDAVTVTRALGVSYLWIDSLCIIQDDNKDWELEAAKMGDVFCSAYCTLAASSATDSLVGFLNKRKPRVCVTIDTSEGPLYLAEAIDNFHIDVEQSVLSKRGWALQERVLSRRTVYFTSTQVYWECGESIFCETLATLSKPLHQFVGESNFPQTAQRGYRDEKIHKLQDLYQVYSTLQLTNTSDRSKAILGLQNRLAQTFESGADHGVHFNYFERTLLWQAEVPREMSPILYPKGNAVPSWSWMAYTGRVRYMEVPFNQVDWTGHIENPFSTQGNGDQWDRRLRAQASDLLISKTELKNRVILDSDENIYDSFRWKTIVVGKSRAANEGGEPVYYVLLIRPVSWFFAIYRRIGVAVLLPDHISPNTKSVFVV